MSKASRKSGSLRSFFAAREIHADVVGAGVIENRNVLAVKALRFEDERVNAKLCNTTIMLLAGGKHCAGVHTGKMRMVCAYRRWETCVRVIQGLLGNILTPACLLAAAVDQMVADDRDGVGLERSAAMIACCRMAQRDAALLKEIVIFHMAVAFRDKPCNRPVDKFQAVFYEQLLFSGQHDAASIHFVSPSFVRSKNPCKAI